MLVGDGKLSIPTVPQVVFVPKCGNISVGERLWRQEEVAALAFSQ